MLLVDYDETQIRERGEDRGAGADHHPRLPERHSHPRVETLARRKVAVPDDHLGAEVGEAGTEATDRLRCQRDFGDQEDCRAAFGHDLANQGDINLGLTRARDAMEQMGAEGLRIKRLRDRGHRGDLLRIQRVASRGDGLPFGIRVVIGHAPKYAGVFLNRTGLDERIHGLLSDAESIDHLGAIGGLFLTSEVIDDLRLARGLLAELGEGFGFGRGDQREQAAQHRADAFADGGRQDGLEHRVQAAAVVARHPFSQLTAVRRHHRLLMLKRDYTTKFRGRRRLRGVFPDHADARATTERYADQLPYLQDIL